jgi:lysophospholipase L1-like esterase
VRLPAASGSASTPHGRTKSVPTSRRLRIMPVGDSITYGMINPNYGGYRHLLGRLLTADGYPFDFVGSQQSGADVIPSSNHEGHPGWTIPEIKYGIDAKHWLETNQPDLILLHIGTNDINRGDAAGAPANLSALLDVILARSPDTRIIVAQIIHPQTGLDRDFLAFDEAIPGIAASKGPRISVVDMQNILTPRDYANSLHPNDKGYDKMAHAWESAIRVADPEASDQASPTTPSQ